MEREELVVPASGAKFGKTLLGGFRVAYPCPRCKRELQTENDAVAGSDKCPHCGASFVFDERIKGAFLALAAEKRARKASKQAEVDAVRLAQAEKAQKNLEAEIQEGFRLVQESNDRTAHESENNVREYREIARQAKQAHVENAKNVNGAYAFLTAVLIAGGIGTAIGLLRAAIAVQQADSFLARSLLIASVSAAVSLMLVYVFFRILTAIHAVLVMILERLPPPNSEGTSTISSESTPRK